MGYPVRVTTATTEIERARELAVREGMKKHFVTFLSPGTFFNEETTKPIDSWDVAKALEMSKTVVERYEQRPYVIQTCRGKFQPFEADDTLLSDEIQLQAQTASTVSVTQAKPQPKPERRFTLRRDYAWSTGVRG
jgi:tRNA/tmRNA/rRNA uracil-C5-methylase (TrmA/RlmC/RlmD family)